MAGKARTLLEATFNVFNTSGENAFLEYWKSIEKPTHWCKLPNPLRHRQSFMFSDTLRLAMLMPFILQRFLKSGHIKVEAVMVWDNVPAKWLGLGRPRTLSQGPWTIIPTN